MPDSFNLARYVIEASYQRSPDSTAIVAFDAALREETWTYRQLAGRCHAVAAALRALDLAPSSRVLVHLQSGPWYAAAALGVIAAGHVVVPTSELLVVDELENATIRAKAAAIIVEPGANQPPSWARLARFHPSELTVPDAETWRFAETVREDPAMLLFTSGTSAQPKGVLHAQRVALGRRPMRDGWTGIRSGDSVVHAGKLNWSYAFGIAVIDTLSCGGTAVLGLGKLEATQWPEIIRSTSAQIFAGVPSLYRQILKYSGDDLRERVASLRHALCAGEPLTPAMLDAWYSRTGLPLYEALGMTECSTYVSSGPATPVKPGSPGRPQAGRHVVVLPVDGSNDPLPVGEVGVLSIHRSDPGLMLGYDDESDRGPNVTRGEYFTTGDLAHIDDQGYVFFHGRRDELMNAFGYRVSPVEVEAALALMPGVVECAVAEVSVGDDVRVICAFIVAKDALMSAESVLEWSASRLAAFKRPREVVFVTTLPRGRNGKVVRSRLSGLAPRESAAARACDPTET